MIDRCQPAVVAAVTLDSRGAILPIYQQDAANLADVMGRSQIDSDVWSEGRTTRPQPLIRVLSLSHCHAKGGGRTGISVFTRHLARLDETTRAVVMTLCEQPPAGRSRGINVHSGSKKG